LASGPAPPEMPTAWWERDRDVDLSDTAEGDHHAQALAHLRGSRTLRSLHPVAVFIRNTLPTSGVWLLFCRRGLFFFLISSLVIFAERPPAGGPTLDLSNSRVRPAGAEALSALRTLPTLEPGPGGGPKGGGSRKGALGRRVGSLGASEGGWDRRIPSYVL